MERYSFATYLVDEYNQEAFSLCHDIANLSSETRQPIVLLGDSGTGKTHLLYSIVGRVRSTNDSTGLAYVTADDFPKSVRDLVNDPRPVQDATNAILLVDQLESFTEDLEILQNVIQLFLDNNHLVACASRVHVSRLENLPGGLAHLLDNGHHVSILPQDSPTRIELLEQTIRNEHDQVITRLENEIADLKQFLTTSSESHEPGADEDNDSLLLSLRKELEVTRTELKLLQTKESAETGNAGDASAIPQEILDELEQLRGENSLNAVATKEASGLRSRIEKLETERDELRIRLSESVDAQATVISDDSADEGSTRSEARALVTRAEQLVKEMQANREEFAESQQLHTRQLEEIHELEKIFQRHEDAAGETGPNLKQLREQQDKWSASITQLEQDRDTLDARIVSREAEIESLTKQCENQREQFALLQEELVAKTEAIVSLDLSLEDARKKESIASLRVNNQIQQYEVHIADLESSKNELKQNEAHLYDELQKIDEALSGAASWIRSAVESYAEEQGEQEDFKPDGVDLDTLEGAALLERIEFETGTSQDAPPPVQDEEEQTTDHEDSSNTSTIPMATLHHVEEIKHNISMLTKGETPNTENDLQSGLGNA